MADRILLFLFFWILFFPVVVKAENSVAFRVHVITVVDGDSFEVQKEDGEKIQVRLPSIDAPEYDQSFSKESKICFPR